MQYSAHKRYSYTEEIVAKGTKPLVLIVDDIAENLQVLGARLRTRGYQVAAASNGFDALRAIELKMPDLILLDIQMPEMDGFEVCQKLQENERTRHIPVVFLTGKTEVEDIVEGFNVGAVDYVTKPFNSAELLTRVRTHLDLKYAQDILRQKNEHLEELNAKLTQLNQEKTEFMGIAAHDLKNPLGAVRWLVDVLRNRQLSTAEFLETLDKITGSVDRMFIIVKNLLDVNAIEEGTVDVKPDEVNAVFLAADVLSQYEERAKHKNITLEFANTASYAKLLINAELLTQILDNVVSNAVKYTPHGKRVLLRIENEAREFQPPANSTNSGEQRDEMHYNAVLRFVIDDEGPGFSDEDKAKLFGKFVQLSARPTGGEHSTGLGLFIVKKLTDIVHGRVWCESEYGAGSRFVLEFPQYIPPSTASVHNEDE